MPINFTTDFFLSVEKPVDKAFNIVVLVRSFMTYIFLVMYEDFGARQFKFLLINTRL
jgi:hypothetical protein